MYTFTILLGVEKRRERETLGLFGLIIFCLFWL
jgi:hypothetical protein